MNGHRRGTREESRKYRKERSKRPHQIKRPGALKSQKIAKNGSNASGRLNIYFYYRKTSRGLLFRAFSRGRLSGVSPRRGGVQKGPAPETERDASRHAVGGIAQVSFFFFVFIHQFKLLLFYFCVSTSRLNTKNTPGTLQTPRGCYFGIAL